MPADLECGPAERLVLPVVDRHVADVEPALASERRSAAVGAGRRPLPLGLGLDPDSRRHGLLRRIDLRARVPGRHWDILARLRASRTRAPMLEIRMTISRANAAPQARGSSCGTPE